MDDIFETNDVDFEELDNVIILNDEAGNEVRFEFLDLIEYEGKEYVVLLPMEDDDGEVVILEVEYDEESDMESYSSVDSDATLEAIFAIFKDKFKSEFNFTE